ncbi:DNA-3-methyladenine glycosylase family protein [Subtercola lobariae]|uniref:3-methyladenine DNA glycosylase n=1 Tax=Subtercola lobariae TaxID=1588641 RepID=A0A917F2F8_9MICO|nr:DNA-3-methyladenine glycosylase 2 family protein [Subtercola lobariae]GGF36351.1 3-methyladenine DNA glycosylase [Subtercola lobariae]
MDALLESAVPLTTTYRPSRPLNLRQTVGTLLRGATEPTMRFTPNGFWRVMRTPLGPVTLQAESDERGDVHARAWGPGAEWVLDALPELLGAGDSWNELDLTSVPMLAEVRRHHPGMWLTCTSLVFESLVPSILEQKVTTIEARRSWHYLLRKFGDAPPGPAPEGMRVQPSARGWQLIPSWEWHRAGVGPDRSRAIVGAAALAAGLDRLASGGARGDQTQTQSKTQAQTQAQTQMQSQTQTQTQSQAQTPAAVQSATLGVGAGYSVRAVRDVTGVLEKLQSVHGVGRWTAAETSQRSHGHPDAVSVGDYHLAAHVGWVLVGKPVDDDGMLELLEPWRGHRQRVVRLILASGIPKPRFGPRATIQDHRFH